MIIRGDAIYLSSEVHRFLRVIAKSINEGIQNRESYITKDQLADNYLRKIITETHPELVELQAELEGIEDRMIERLRETALRKNIE